MPEVLQQCSRVAPAATPSFWCVEAIVHGAKSRHTGVPSSSLLPAGTCCTHLGNFIPTLGLHSNKVDRKSNPIGSQWLWEAGGQGMWVPLGLLELLDDLGRSLCPLQLLLLPGDALK